jgi:hypothetical protein
MYATLSCQGRVNKKTSIDLAASIDEVHQVLYRVLVSAALVGIRPAGVPSFEDLRFFESLDRLV